MIELETDALSSRRGNDLTPHFFTKVNIVPEISTLVVNVRWEKISRTAP